MTALASLDTVPYALALGVYSNGRQMSLFGESLEFVSTGLNDNAIYNDGGDY